MALHTITLIKKELVANNTMAFHFKKPEGFNYVAGQYGDFTLIDPAETDEEGDKRTFSFASAPHESDLTVTTRLRDTAFKRVLRNLTGGSEVQLEGPFGSLALPKNTAKTAVFLTGGIGATLVRSIVSQAIYDRAPHTMIFFYSNHTKEDTVFFEEFTTLAEAHDNFLFIPIMTNETSEWTGERGEINRAMLEKYVPDIAGSIYYLSGPSAMVGTMRKLLLDARVDRTNIRADQFIGY